MWSDQGGPWLEVGCGKLKCWEPAPGLSWQLMKASEQRSEHNWLVLYQNLQKLFAFLAGPRAGLWLVWGRGLGAQGNRSPDLHPEAIFPGSFLPHSGSLPWSWIRPFQPSHPGYTAQPEWLGQTQRLRSPPTRHGSTHQQLGRPLSGGQKWPNFSLAPGCLICLRAEAQGQITLEQVKGAMPSAGPLSPSLAALAFSLSSPCHERVAPQRQPQLPVPCRVLEYSDGTGQRAGGAAQPALARPHLLPRSPLQELRLHLRGHRREEHGLALHALGRQAGYLCGVETLIHKVQPLGLFVLS